MLGFLNLFTKPTIKIKFLIPHGDAYFFGKGT